MSRTLASLLSALLLSLATSPAQADEPDARAIMQQVKDRELGNNARMDMEMILIDARGNQRQRLLRSYRRDDPDNPDNSQSIMFFLAPANVEDTGFLSYDYDEADRDDEQWLYLPALKKVKRIAAADKSSSFMGSDFTYADMSSPNIDDYRYELMKETKIGEHAVWQIKSTPIKEEEIKRSGYKQSVVFVRQDNFVVVRAVNWLAQGNKLKFMEIKDLEQIDGIWTAKELIMSTRQGKVTEHASILRLSDIEYGLDLPDELFSQRRLSRGAE